MKARVIKVKLCDLTECQHECGDECQNLTVDALVVPLYDVEAECPQVEATLRFGNRNEVAPWTYREIQADLVPMPWGLTVESTDG